MQTVAVEDWAADWARRARELPNGRIVAGLLVDLIADPRQHLARTATFPVTAAALALRVEPGLLRTALQDLADAGLLELDCHEASGATGEFAVVTLTSPTPLRAPKRPRHDAGDTAPEPHGRPWPSDDALGPPERTGRP
ncbi:hypothetical protein ACFV4G_11155 [Kitasatospora sp. NPDC059747]|uniref:hypothetical protein n=1 Tax=Kitasatospora sp. NPDC059747 TaxID=3346930 RepID=UPI00364ECBED